MSQTTARSCSLTRSWILSSASARGRSHLGLSPMPTMRWTMAGMTPFRWWPLCLAKSSSCLLRLKKYRLKRFFRQFVKAGCTSSGPRSSKFISMCGEAESRARVGRCRSLLRRCSSQTPTRATTRPSNIFGTSSRNRNGSSSTPRIENCSSCPGNTPTLDRLPATRPLSTSGSTAVSTSTNARE